MKPKCSCGFDMQPLTPGIIICRRCDTTPLNGMRVGPPNNPGTTNGWFPASFGDRP